MIMNGKKTEIWRIQLKKKGMQLKKRLWSSVFSRSFLNYINNNVINNHKAIEVGSYQDCLL